MDRNEVSYFAVGAILSTLGIHVIYCGGGSPYRKFPPGSLIAALSRCRSCVGLFG